MLSGLLAGAQPRPQTAIDTIATLCDRLTNSTMLEDRRAAVLGLKGLSREFRETVAANGLRGLMTCLQRDNEDTETCRATLETLIILFINDSNSDQLTETLSQRFPHKQYKSPLRNESHKHEDFISLWIADEFTQKEENMIILIELAKEQDFYTKLYSLQLLSSIMANRLKRAQEGIFAAQGIPTLVSALSDPREVIRNEAILVLINLVKGQSDIQKLVAFQDGFGKVFDIISSEGGVFSGIVVGDCLLLLANLLAFNVSNQNYMRETGQFARLKDLIMIPVDDTGAMTYSWSEQSVENMRTVLNICRLFVEEGQDSTPPNQFAFAKTGMLVEVLKLAFGPQTYLSIRSIALLTAADIVRSNNALQQQVLGIDVPCADLTLARSQQPQILPVVHCLLNWCLLPSSIHVFNLRLASEICLLAVFQDYHSASAQYLQEQITSDSILIRSVTEHDSESRINPYRVWFASVILINFFNNHENAKDILRQGRSIAKPNAIETTGTNKSENRTDENIINETNDNAHSNLNGNTFNECADVVEKQDNLTENSATDMHVEKSLQIRETESNDTDEELEDDVSVIQSISGVLIASLNDKEPRVSIALFMLLSVWLFDDVHAVDDLLGDSSLISTLIAFITNSTGDSVLESMAAVLLGIIYDFSRAGSRVSRTELYRLLCSNIGKDQFALKVQRLRDLSTFKDFDASESVVQTEVDESGLPAVFFDEVYVSLIKEHLKRISRALRRGPNVQPNSKISLDMYDELQSKFLELKNEKEKADNLMSSLKNELTEMTTYSEKLKLSSSENSSKLAVIQKDHADLKRSFDEKVDELKKVVAAKAIVDKNFKGSQQSIIELNALVEENKQKMVKIQSQLDAANSLKEKAENGINKMSRELAQLFREKETLEKDLKVAQKATTTESDKASKLSSQLEKTKSQLKEKDSQVRGLEKELSNLKKSTQELRSELQENESIKGQVISKLQVAAQQIESHKAQSVKLNDTISTLEAEKKELADELSSASSEVEKIRKTLNENKKDLQVKSEEITKLSTSSSELQQQLSDLKFEKEALEKRISEAQTLNEELKAKLDESNLKLIKALDESKSNQVETDKQLSKLQRDFDTLKTDNSSVLKSLAETKTALVEAQAAVKLYEDKEKDNGVEISKLKIELTKKDQELKSLEESSSESNLAEVLQKKVQETTEELAKSNNEITATKEKMKKFVEETVVVKKQLAQANNEIGELKKTKESNTSAQLEALKKRAEESEKRANEMSEKMNSMVAQEDMDDLMLLLEDMENKKNKYKKLLQKASIDVSDISDDDSDNDDDED